MFILQRRLFKRRASGATEDGASHNGSASQHRRLAPIHEELDEDDLDEWENAKRINLVIWAGIHLTVVIRCYTIIQCKIELYVFILCRYKQHYLGIRLDLKSNIEPLFDLLFDPE